MTDKILKLAMNGVTGRMGANQHLARSIMAIRDQGGVTLADGTRVIPDPVLVGRDAGKLEALAKAHGLSAWSTDIDAVLGDASIPLFFDTALTQGRAALLHRAIEAGKHVYTEKPSAATLEDALSLFRHARDAGVKHGVVQDKLWLPGMLKLKFLIDSGFFGRLLSVRGEFGYWIFDGALQPAQRPSWNYRKEDGGGIILDMMPHWRYLLDNTLGAVQSVSCLGATAIPERWDERGERYDATADDGAYTTMLLEGGVIAPFQLLVDDARAPRRSAHPACRRHRGLGGDRPARGPHPRPREHAETGLESRHSLDHRPFRPLATGSGHGRLRQRVQGRVGAVHQASVR